MNIYLYKNGTEKERVDKTNYLTQITAMTGAIRDEADIINPTVRFTLEGSFDFSSLNSANYAFFEEWGRYYYITDRTVIRANVHDVTFHEDVLFTWKTGILNQRAVIGRQQTQYNTLLADNWKVHQKTIVNTIQFPHGFDNSVNPSILMTISGHESVLP